MRLRGENEGERGAGSEGAAGEKRTKRSAAPKSGIYPCHDKNRHDAGHRGAGEAAHTESGACPAKVPDALVTERSKPEVREGCEAKRREMLRVGLSA